MNYWCALYFRVVYEDFFIATSCLEAASKKCTKTILARLGGHLCSEWTSQCKLLIMSELSVTIKVSLLST